MSYRKYKSAARDLISYTYHHGYKVRVWDEWDAQWIEFKDAKTAWQEIDAVDGGEDFVIFDSEGHRIGGVMLAIGYGNQPDEEVADFTVCKFIDDWFDDFIKRY